jgi:hypothetical protein
LRRSPASPDSTYHLRFLEDGLAFDFCRAYIALLVSSFRV